MKDVKVTVAYDQEGTTNFKIMASEADLGDILDIMASISYILHEEDEEAFKDVPISGLEEPGTAVQEAPVSAKYQVVRARGYQHRKHHLMVKNRHIETYTSLCGIMAGVSIAEMGKSLNTKDVNWDAASEVFQRLPGNERCDRCMLSLRAHPEGKYRIADIR